MNEPQLIFKAELIEKDGKNDIQITNNSSHVPTLSILLTELQYIITELKAMERTKREIESMPQIQMPKGNIIDFLKRRIT